MTYKSSITYAWGIYAGAIIIELLVDYLIRIKSENFYSNGIPESMWFLLQILAATVGVYFIIYGAKYLKNIKHKITHVFANLIIGILFYTLIVYSYVLGLGIDSF